MPKTFTMIVEGGYGPDHEPLPNKIKREIPWDGDMAPDVIVLPEGMFVKSGRYLSPGDRYCFREAVILDLSKES